MSHELLLYSIRMRASVSSRHLSGAERVVPPEKIGSVVHDLTTRALSKGYTPDQIIVTIDSLSGQPVRKLTALDLVTVNAGDEAACRTEAACVLKKAGVSLQAIDAAIAALDAGPAPSGENMRGAMILDAQTGERLEPDRERGIRVSRFDWDDDASIKIDRQLAAIGLTHFRTKEALALATKTAHAPGFVAELCWSDDPDYTAGYVSSRATGYVRFPILKEIGHAKGGRAFFVDRAGFNMEAFVTYLQKEPILIDGIGVCNCAVEPEDYFFAKRQP